LTRARDVASVLTAASALSTDVESAAAAASAVSTHEGLSDPHTGYVLESGGSTITAASASTKPLILKGASSQTANLQEWQDSSGSILSRIGLDGRGRIGGSNGVGTGITSSTFGTGSIDPSWSVLTVKGTTSQSGNLQEWQNSSGTVLAKVNSSGSFNAVGLTLSSAVSGDMFVVDPTYGNITSRGGAVGFAGSASLNIGTYYNAGSAIVASGFSGQSVPTVIIRAVTSQTGNLQEWQNSSGTVLSNINSSGSLELNGKDPEIMTIMGAYL
jgi:hypothetical protein